MAALLQVRHFDLMHTGCVRSFDMRTAYAGNTVRALWQCRLQSACARMETHRLHRVQIAREPVVHTRGYSAAHMSAILLKVHGAHSTFALRA